MAKARKPVKPPKARGSILFGSAPKCGGCGRGVPKGDAFCRKCGNVGGTRPSGTVGASPAARAAAPHACGARTSPVTWCHATVRGGVCPNGDNHM